MFGFQTCLAWPQNTHASLVELFGNFGYTITGQSAEETDMDWFASLYRDEGWQAILVDCDLRSQGDDQYSFPVVIWQWESPAMDSSYQIDIICPGW
jgi:hypothetical protein